MARFYDFLMARRDKLEPMAQELIKDCVVIKIDNVHNYLVGINQSEFARLIQTPVVVPPFHKTFMEFRKSLKPRGYIDLGIVLIHEKLTPEQLWGIINNTPMAEETHQDAEHSIACMVLMSFRNIGKVLGTIWLFADHEGNLIYPVQNTLPKIGEIEPLNIDIMSSVTIGLTFLNAKNTELIDNPPPAKLSKRHEEKYGVPLVTYKTLKVNPIRKVNANDYDADDSDGESIPKSLHIARGHFKDYRNGPGLFGKYQDIFWWDAHVRGNAKKGVIVKDYDVQAPDDEGA